MATRENLRTRLARVRAETVRSGRVVLETPLLSSCAQAAVHFLLGAVLAGGRIFGGYAPFGTALVGGAGSGINAAMALMGASFGYLTLLGLVDGLRYVSAATLTFSVAFAFYDVKLYRMPWTMPVVAALMNGCTGFIYLSQQGWRTQDAIWFVLELAITAGAAYGFRAALAPGGREEDEGHRLGGAALLAAVLISLSQLYIYQDISLGRLLTAAVVLACGWQGGAGTGAGLGVALGLALDLAAEGRAIYAMAFGAAGLVCGLFRGSRRLSAAVAFVLADAAAVLWLWGDGMPVSILYEVFGASVLFMLVPGTLLRQLGGQLACRERETEEAWGRAYVKERLEQVAGAFQTLHETMRTAFRQPGSNDADPAVIFDRAADRVCRSCALRGTCWERDYVTTVNALNDATQTMLARGRGEAGDFPGYFTSRCLRFPAFLSAVNEELTGLLCRRQYDSRIRDSRRAVCRQYGQLSEVLAAAAAELGQELTPDPARERRLRQHLAVLGLEGDAAVFYDRDRHLRAEIVGPACRRLGREGELATLAALLGVSVRVEESGAERLVLVQREPLMAVAGIAAQRKDGEVVSGDAGTWFKREDGRLFVLLCDGMGSGPAANRESGLAVRLLEQFLRAGLDSRTALGILNSALALRGEDEGGFTTVDLFQVDLFTGEGEVCKFGAAPTYVKTRDGVRRLAGSALPAGLADGEGARPDCISLRLEPGDCVLMVSDGVCPDQEDGWLRGRLADFDGGSPKDLARALLDEGPEEGRTDDRTALVIRIGPRGPQQ